MASNMAQAIGSILSVALLTSGGGPAKHWQVGDTGYRVAEVEAELGVLGFDAGPVNGRVSQRMLQGADDYVAAFGLLAHRSVRTDLKKTIKAMGTVPGGTHGTLVLAVENDLRMLGLYHGPLNGQWSSQLKTAIQTFDHKMGQPADGTLSPSILTLIAHMTAVRVTARHHWAYQVRPGDTMSSLAFASGLSYQGFLNANHQHGAQLDVGQTIHWHTARHVSSKTSRSPSTPRDSKSPTSSSSPSQSGSSTGVLADLKPISDLVVYNPSASDVHSLMAAEEKAHVSVDVAVSGQWALTHPTLMHTLSRLGNELDLNGYSGQSLNSLPAWGVKQELTWGVHAFQDSLGRAPTFIISTAPPNSTVKSAADALKLVTMSPSEVLTSKKNRTERALAALLSHPNRVVEVSEPLDWPRLFRDLKAKSFVFETLGQIWAGE